MSVDLSAYETATLERLRNEPALAPIYRERIAAELRERVPETRSGNRKPRRLADADDPRPEDEIRAEQKDWCWAHGAAWIGDTEQGYRPDDCPHCKRSLGKGARTRVTEGMADLLVVWKPEVGGNVWLIESKSAVGVQSPKQRALEAECKLAGVTYVLARGTGELEERWKEEGRTDG